MAIVWTFLVTSILVLFSFPILLKWFLLGAIISILVKIIAR